MYEGKEQSTFCYKHLYYFLKNYKSSFHVFKIIHLYFYIHLHSFGWKTFPELFIFFIKIIYLLNLLIV